MAFCLVLGCPSEPPSREKLQAASDKSQPAVAVLSPKQPQQIRPEQLVLKPVEQSGLSEERKVDPKDFFINDGNRGGAKAEVDEFEVNPVIPPPPPPLPTLMQRARAAVGLLPPGVLKKVALDGDDEVGIDVTGQAKSEEDVADVMRALSTFVLTPQGPARVVERKREAMTARVELLAPPGDIREYTVAELQPMAVALLAADQAKGGGVAFRIKVTQARPRTP